MMTPEGLSMLGPNDNRTKIQDLPSDSSLACAENITENTKTTLINMSNPSWVSKTSRLMY